MENNNYFDELIVSYLSRELNEEEEIFVLDWINSSDEHRQYFEKLKSAWILLGAKQTAKNINIDSEWNQFQQIISAKKLIDLEAEPVIGTAETLNEDNIKRKRGHRRMLGITSIVCCIVIAFALTWKLGYFNPAVRKTRFAATLSRAKPAGIKHISTGDSSRYLVLQDGTDVLLHPNSEMTYHEPFINNRRDITLVGKAEFTVAKDKLKPFTVMSGDLSTTALGTRFTVTAFVNEKSILVTLYEGKVVVKSRKGTKRKLDKDYSLLPGHQLVYNNRNITARIHKFGINDHVRVKSKSKTNEKQLIDNPSLPTTKTGEWYMFNNQPLNEVYDQLEAYYGIHIEYKKSEVSKNYFIGPFDRTDSAEAVLKKISALNNLKVIKTSKGFLISR